MSDYTAQDSYDALHGIEERFLDGSVSAARLYGWLLNGYATPIGTPSKDPANLLWKAVVTQVGVFTNCDMERSMLEESLRRRRDDARNGAFAVFTPITRSRCFPEVFKHGNVPASLQWRDSTQDVLRLESFRDLQPVSDRASRRGNESTTRYFRVREGWPNNIVIYFTIQSGIIQAGRLAAHRCA